MSGYIGSLRASIHQWFLNKELKDRRFERRRVNFEKAQTIGILFDATEVDGRQVVLDYAERLRKQGKRVRLLGYFSNQEKGASFSFPYFSRAQIDWALRPGGTEVKAFLDQEFDLFIFLNTSSTLYGDYIAHLCRAHLKAGPPGTAKAPYELMIAVQHKERLTDFIRQMELLLAKTNPHHEAA